MLFRMVERRSRIVKAPIGIAGDGLGADSLQAASFGRLEPCSLASLDFRSGDFGELGSAGFADQESDFVVGGTASLDRDEFGDGLVSLLAALAVLDDEIFGDAADLKSQVAAFGIAPVFDLVAQGAD